MLHATPFKGKFASLHTWSAGSSKAAVAGARQAGRQCMGGGLPQAPLDVDTKASQPSTTLDDAPSVADAGNGKGSFQPPPSAHTAIGGTLSPPATPHVQHIVLPTHLTPSTLAGDCWVQAGPWAACSCFPQHICRCTPLSSSCPARLLQVGRTPADNLALSRCEGCWSDQAFNVTAMTIINAGCNPSFPNTAACRFQVWRAIPLN